MGAAIIVQAPVRGEWAIMNPPAHPRLVVDLLAVDGEKYPYKDTSLLRHIFSTITVQHTYAWAMPVYAVSSGKVVSACDGVPDRLRLSMVKDFLRRLFVRAAPFDR